MSPISQDPPSHSLGDPPGVLSWSVLSCFNPVSSGFSAELITEMDTGRGRKLSPPCAHDRQRREQPTAAERWPAPGAQPQARRASAPWPGAGGLGEWAVGAGILQAKHQHKGRPALGRLLTDGHFWPGARVEWPPALCPRSCRPSAWGDRGRADGGGSLLCQLRAPTLTMPARVLAPLPSPHHLPSSATPCHRRWATSDKGDGRVLCSDVWASEGQQPRPGG